MKKIAIFVEGKTELQFARTLLIEIAGRKNIVFHEEVWHAGGFITLKTEAPNNATHFALLVDCRGDGGVKSAILDRRDNLITAGTV
jgi:hypothetical protein